MPVEKILLQELNLCFKYFYENTNLKKDSVCFGLTRDNLKNIDIASISATGYAITAMVVAVKNGWISYDEGYNIVLNTFDTLLNLENKNGFYFRYINLKTGMRELNSEISIIDTGILLCGVLSAGEFFKGVVKEKADIIYLRVNWNWYLDKEKKQFRLGYKPSRGFYGYWDNYAEQLILYILGAGSPTYPIIKEVYYSFKRNKQDYGTYKNIIYSWFGSLFTYQYSHAWIDFKDTYDEDNVNWFANSVRATLANIQYCYDNREICKTFKLGYWGLSATITKKRYSGRHGSSPCMYKIKIDGTVSLSAIISSIIFVPEEVKATVLKLYNNYPEAFSKYGFVTSMNLVGRKPWFSDEYLGIDKGTTLVMLENYFNNTIWELFMNNEYVKFGMKKLAIKKNNAFDISN